MCRQPTRCTYSVALTALSLHSPPLKIYSITTGTWTTGANMPGARYFPGAAYYGSNNKIYVAGGFDSTFTETNTTWEYDPVANTWNTSRAPIPTPIGGAGYSIVGQNMYLAGTWNNASGSWAAVPVPIYRPASAAVATQEFLVGGGNPDFLGSGKTQRPHPVAKTASTRSPATAYTSTYIYDTVTDSWSSGPVTNVPHSFTGGTAIGGLLLVVTDLTGPLVIQTSWRAVSLGDPAGRHHPLLQRRRRSRPLRQQQPRRRRRKRRGLPRRHGLGRHRRRVP